jgi:hypothetical protein
VADDLLEVTMNDFLFVNVIRDPSLVVLEAVNVIFRRRALTFKWKNFVLALPSLILVMRERCFLRALSNIVCYETEVLIKMCVCMYNA